jgi:hypothetical protein
LSVVECVRNGRGDLEQLVPKAPVDLTSNHIFYFI